MGNTWVGMLAPEPRQRQWDSRERDVAEFQLPNHEPWLSLRHGLLTIYQKVDGSHFSMDSEI